MQFQHSFIEDNSAACEVPGVVGVGRVMADGTDEDGPTPRGWMNGWRGKRWKGQPPGARVNLSCFFFPMFRFPINILL
jgi:hypothetical protein